MIAQSDLLAERAAVWLFRAKTARLKAEDAERAQMTWDQVLDQQDRDAWIRYAKDMLTDIGCGHE